MYKAGDVVSIEIETVTTENIDRFANDKPYPVVLYKLKGIPIYFSEDDLKQMVADTATIS